MLWLSLWSQAQRQLRVQHLERLSQAWHKQAFEACRCEKKEERREDEDLEILPNHFKHVLTPCEHLNAIKNFPCFIGLNKLLLQTPYP